MEKTEIIERLTPIARELFSSPELVITDELSASDVEGWTSLSFMQLLDRIEKEFGFKFKIFELINIKNFGGLVAAIKNHC